MDDKPQTLWGFPVITTDRAPKGQIILGPLPTYADLLRYGSWEAFIEAERKRFCKIININESE